jgi:hypothetical protein
MHLPWHAVQACVHSIDVHVTVLVHSSQAALQGCADDRESCFAITESSEKSLCEGSCM